MSKRLRTKDRQLGFSIVEFMVTAFVIAIGLLGLTMFQAISMRTGSGSRTVNTAVMIGEGILESIQSEGRQRLLFLRYAGTQPATTYFKPTNDVVNQYYAFDGSLLPDATNAYYTVQITPSDIVSTAGSTTGGTKLFTLKVSFTDVVTGGGTPHTRTVTLTRQVAYA